MLLRRAPGHLYKITRCINITRCHASAANSAKKASENNANTRDWNEIVQSALDDRLNQSVSTSGASKTSQDTAQSTLTNRIQKSWDFYQKYSEKSGQVPAGCRMPLHIASLFPYQPIPEKKLDQALAQLSENVQTQSKSKLSLDSLSEQSEVMMLSAEDFLQWIKWDYREYGCQERVNFIAKLMQDAGYDCKGHMNENFFLK